MSLSTKKIIITGSENVLPSEVENALAGEPVDRCVVVGYDHPKYGESIAAAIILREDEPHYAEILDQHMRSRLAGYKVQYYVCTSDTYAVKQYAEVTE
ncbi:AMP-binding enzyme [Staphylococcus aureus]